ncbi:putative MFS allantoate transporter [Thozetella sp. PMI_491]|nr:putative MFS allantoate transporter [Thozetella sp. PMI_491]
MCLLPFMFVSYMLQYLDKSAMGYSSILGLRKDLNLVGQDYSWASSIFYFGYFVASGGVALLLVKLPIGRTLSVAMALWATILMLTSTCTNASGLLAARFFLGFVESAIAPAMSIVVSMWYKRTEQPLRQAAWFMGNVMGGLFGSLLGYGIGHLAWSPWKALFLIFGGATLLWSVVCFFFIPDSPLTAWFLSPEDRYKAIQRVQSNMTGFKSHEWKWDQMWEAVYDPKTWFLAFFQFTQNLPNGAFTSIVISGFGFSTFDTLLVQMIGSAFQFTFVLISALGSTYFKNTRTLWMAWTTLMALIGTVMIRQIPNEHIWSKFMGYCLIIGFSASFPLTFAMITANTAGFTKKTTVSAIVFSMYCIGNIAGPQVMFDREAPSYPSGFAAILVCFSASIVIILSLRVYLIWENKKRDALGPVTEGVDVDAAPVEVLDENNISDKTDREMPQFRYVY